MHASRSRSAVISVYDDAGNVIAGLWLGVLYLQQRRTLWAVITAHGIADTVAMLAFFYGWL